MKTTIFDKLTLLSDAAKYDVSCSSSGAQTQKNYGGIGATHNSGICHTFTSDGRCVSLLKVLLTNFCIYDCAYCINRVSNDLRRVAFSPRELADLTINFYKRNYIEGLFLSSGIIESEDHTMELLIRTLKILRYEHGFNGYIHVKLIPGANERLVEIVCTLASRVSSNIELPTSRGLKLLAPQKSREKLLEPLKQARDITLSKASKPIPMSTQMIIGATNDSDRDILKTSSVLYEKALLKRVYYSAYIPINTDKNLPMLKDQMPPIAREHRLYQADWLLRFYGFDYRELFGQKTHNLDIDIDPKTSWALSNLDLFPIDVNKVSKEILLRIPGIGLRGAYKILRARKYKNLGFDELKKLHISLKRAQYFIINKTSYQKRVPMYAENIKKALIEPKKIIQPSLF